MVDEAIFGWHGNIVDLLFCIFTSRISNMASILAGTWVMRMTECLRLSYHLLFSTWGF